MDCNRLCTANPEEFCGGFNAIEVFQIGDPEETDDSAGPVIPVNNTETDYNYIGCYADPAASRSMLFEDSTDAMSPAVRSSRRLCAVLSVYVCRVCRVGCLVAWLLRAFRVAQRSPCQTKTLQASFRCPQTGPRSSNPMHAAVDGT